MSAFGYKRTFNHTLNYVRFTPESRHLGRGRYTSAYDPKRTLTVLVNVDGKLDIANPLLLVCRGFHIHLCIMLFNSADAIAALISNVIIVMLPRFAPHALQRLLRPISGIGGGHQHFNSCLATICIRPVALSFCHVLKVSERQFRRCPSKKTASTTGIEKR